MVQKFSAPFCIYVCMNNIRKTIEENITDDGTTPDDVDAGGGGGNNVDEKR